MEDMSGFRISDSGWACFGDCREREREEEKGREEEGRFNLKLKFGFSFFNTVCND